MNAMVAKTNWRKERALFVRATMRGLERAGVAARSAAAKNEEPVANSRMPPQHTPVKAKPKKATGWEMDC